MRHACRTHVAHMLHICKTHAKRGRGAGSRFSLRSKPLATLLGFAGSPCACSAPSRGLRPCRNHRCDSGIKPEDFPSWRGGVPALPEGRRGPGTGGLVARAKRMSPRSRREHRRVVVGLRPHRCIPPLLSIARRGASPVLRTGVSGIPPLSRATHFGASTNS